MPLCEWGVLRKPSRANVRLEIELAEFKVRFFATAHQSVRSRKCVSVCICTWPMGVYGNYSQNSLRKTISYLSK